MLACYMSQERTLGDYLQMLDGSGWKLVEIISVSPSAAPHLVLVVEDGHLASK
jgi:hypothetical protein